MVSEQFNVLRCLDSLSFQRSHISWLNKCFIEGVEIIFIHQHFASVLFVCYTMLPVSLCNKRKSFSAVCTQYGLIAYCLWSWHPWPFWLVSELRAFFCTTVAAYSTGIWRRKCLVSSSTTTPQIKVRGIYKPFLLVECRMHVTANNNLHSTFSFFVVE